MDTAAPPPRLRVLAYPLLFRPFPEPFAHLAKMREDYSPTEYGALIDSLEWAARHPTYPFSTLLPGLAATDPEIHAHFVRLLKAASISG